MATMVNHHALLLSAEDPFTFDAAAEGYTVSTQYRLPQLGIGDVRVLIDAAHRRPQEAEEQTQTLLIATEFITEEAQQALLKLIEEPPSSTAFLFVLPYGYTLIPTLESRFERRGSGQGEIDSSVFQHFLESSYAERMSVIEESTKKKDLVWQTNIKRGVVAYLLAHRSTLAHEVVIELEYVARTLLTRGASNKLLLEHLALTLPI